MLCLLIELLPEKDEINVPIALSAVRDGLSAVRDGSFYLPSFCLSGSFNFIFPTVLQSSTVECVLNSEPEVLLVVGIHFVRP